MKHISFHNYMATTYVTGVNTATELVPRSWVLSEKLIITHLIKIFSLFTEPDGSLPCSQQPITGP